MRSRRAAWVKDKSGERERQPSRETLISAPPRRIHSHTGAFARCSPQRIAPISVERRAQDEILKNGKEIAKEQERLAESGCSQFNYFWNAEDSKSHSVYLTLSSVLMQGIHLKL